MHRLALGFVCASIALPVVARTADGERGGSARERRMSFHNRLLLNRAVLAGLQSVEVLLLAGGRPEGQRYRGRPEGLRYDGLPRVGAAVETLGGRVVRSEADIGYLRVEIAPDRLLELVESPEIEAYQISSLSLGTWYRDGPPMANATLQRSFEVSPIAPDTASGDFALLPALTHEESRAPGFTADGDVGVGEWMRTHPTFDGRGVTIALVESGLPSFTDPVFRTAKTLDGREVPKIAGILNTIDPASPDETRVRLDTPIEAAKSWARVGNRTYVLPRPGRFRAGTLDVPGGGNVIQRFMVLEEEGSGTVWIDTDGDASFQNEEPVADVNERFQPKSLTLTYPHRMEVSFVMGRGREPHVVHVYLGKSGHQTMTASVAAGNVTPDSLASGVAPGARLLFVRVSSPNLGGVGRLVEGFIDVARRPDVDVISASTPIAMVPDTAADFVGLSFSRLHEAYGKPILNGAGNYGLALGQVHANGGVLSVGGLLSPESFAALYGGRELADTTVHVMSGVGPGIDGSIEPDFLAPVQRLSATVPWKAEIAAAPANAPARRLPPGYAISCCTSSSSPYAAGAVALLISGAKQSGVPYSSQTLRRALTVTARPVPGFQSFHQGNGALDILAAWRALRDPFEPPDIVSSATVVHPLAQYAARGHEGSGILEFQGWKPGMKGIREIRFTRTSGPARPLTYRVAWSADDGTFTTPASLTLPLNESVSLPVDVDARTAGAHSGLLTLHDEQTGAVAFRTQATIVVPEPLRDARHASLELSGTAGSMLARAHYLDIPAATAALSLELRVLRGAATPSVFQSHGLPNSYYMHVHPMETISLGPGTYRVRMPHPEPGTWTVRLKNWSAMLASRQFGFMGATGSLEDVDYRLTARLLAASLRPRRADGGSVEVDLENRGSTVVEPVLEAWPGSLRSHRQRFRPDGLANLVEIDVPADAATLSLQLRAHGSGTELFLYDCTTGQCFSYDIAFPAAESQALMVRRPAAGRWVAAVNAAPFPAAKGSFVLDEVITTGPPVRHASGGERATGERWRQVLPRLPQSAPAEGRTPVVFFELIDRAAERDEKEHPWSRAAHFIQLRDRPVAIATAIYRP